MMSVGVMGAGGWGGSGLRLRAGSGVGAGGSSGRREGQGGAVGAPHHLFLWRHPVMSSIIIIYHPYLLIPISHLLHGKLFEQKTEEEETGTGTDRDGR